MWGGGASSSDKGTLGAISILVQKIGSAPPFGQRMPRNGPPYLTDGQILVIKRWIENGAPRN